MVSKSIIAEHTIHLMNSSTMTIEESIVGNSDGYTGVVLSIFCNGILLYRVQGVHDKSGKFKTIKKKENKITKKVAKVLLEAI